MLNKLNQVKYHLLGFVILALVYVGWWKFFLTLDGVDAFLFGAISIIFGLLPWATALIALGQHFFVTLSPSLKNLA